MLFRIAADGVLLIHLLFIVFVMLGGALAFRWRWVAFVHLPAAAWGIFVELTGRICPLTYIENDFRRQAGQAGYGEGCIEHYLLSIIYPLGLTPEKQYILAGIVIATNILLYGCLIRRWRVDGKPRFIGRGDQ